jgi:CopA family copper-resistance protein
MTQLSRRRLLQMAATSTAMASFGGLMPAWAQTGRDGNLGIPALTGSQFDLAIHKFPVQINGRNGSALGINGTLPGPLVRFREGDDITINVTNRLDEDTSIHWHGLLVPFYMDGVPGIAFPGIKPGETFTYKWNLNHSGTYWYHSHSGLQEQLGHYGPLIIDPKGDDPVSYDREYVLVLSDWSFESPHRIFSKLKKAGATYNYQKRTVGDFIDDVSTKGLGKTIKDRAMWNQMRMSQTDWEDISAATYTFLINGHSTADNWDAIFSPGEKVRLRIINASAMSIFNFRIPGLPMTVVASDGLNVQPVETDEFQIGVAETYDVIVSPRDERAYAITAESIGRSGQVIATLAPRAGMRAEPPQLRKPTLLTMKDMGMGGMDHGSMSGMGTMEGMDHSSMSGMGSMEGMDHSAMSGMADDAMGDMSTIAPEVERGPGVVGIAMSPVSRLDEPGQGLEKVPHRVLRYSQLRSLEINPDLRTHEREIELHLTSNMERYMWSFNGVRFAYIDEAIKFYKGERLRLTMINDTMMPHPIHLHGMFFDVVNGGGDHKPRKHTIIVKPGEKLSVDISAEHIGDWAFHCHLLYHMHAGMMQVVSVLPYANPNALDDQRMKKTKGMDHMNMPGMVKDKPMETM